MAKDKEKDSGGSDAMDALKLDLEFRNRQLAAEKAQAAAELAFQKKRMELVELGMMKQEADQFAKQYALEVATFEFERDLNNRKFGLDQQNIKFQQELAVRQQAFEEQWKFPEQQRQFNISTIMNAPRGAADYATYMDRLRGLNTQGLLGGVIGNVLQGGRVASRAWNGGQNAPLPASNTDLAGALIRNNPGAYGPLPSVSTFNGLVANNPPPSSTPTPTVANNGYTGVDRSKLNPEQQKAYDKYYGILKQVVPGISFGVKSDSQYAYAQNPSQTPTAPATSIGPGTTYSAQENTYTGGAYGGGGGYGGNLESDAAVRRMFERGMTSTPNVNTGEQVSLQSWRNLSPTEQSYAQGVVEQQTGQNAQDFDWAMKNAAPNFNQANRSRIVY